MIKYKNKIILEEIGSPFFVCKEPDNNHNEITIGKRYYKLVLSNILPYNYRMSNQLLNKIRIAAKGFKNVNTVNLERDYAVIYFTIKAKTERRKEDDNDIELAKKIVLSKVNKQAYKFTEKIIMSIFAYFMDSNFEIAEILKKMVRCNKRESAYFNKLVTFNKYKK